MDAYWANWADRLKTIDENPIRLMNWLLHGMGIDGAVSTLIYSALPTDQQTDIESKLGRLLKHEPLSKILGDQDFYGRSFKTTKDTLDPRADSEALIDAIAAEMNGKDPLTLLDLGTGTGCLIITLLLRFPHATGVAVDLSDAALAVARENAQTHGVLDRLTLIQSDWFKNVPVQAFDGIIANPPYIVDTYPLSEAVAAYDPSIALFGGPDGLDAYRHIFMGISPYCTDNTRIAVEIGYDQIEAVPKIAGTHGFQLIASKKDWGNVTRALVFKP